MLTPLATPLATPRATPLATPLQTAAERASGNKYRRQCRDISGRLRQRQRRRLSGPAPRPDTRRRHVQQIPSLTNAPTTATTSRRTSRRGPRKPRRRSIPTPTHTHKPTAVRERVPMPVPTSTSPTEPTPLPTPAQTTAMTTRPTRAPTLAKYQPDEGGLTVVEPNLDRKPALVQRKHLPVLVQRKHLPEPSHGRAAVAANIRDRRRRPQTQPDPANFTQVKHTRWTENDSHHLVFHGEIFIPEGFLDKTRPVTFT